MKIIQSNVNSIAQIILNFFKSSSNSPTLLVCIPLVLSSFTHFWNPTGFPNILIDEDHYMRRAMRVLEGLGPQESTLYDHPYFGQLFLAFIFYIIGYPNSLHPLPDSFSAEMLYAVPRGLMGLLAVLDTFLIYKIAERRYNRNVAFFASFLFAVMPYGGWYTRRILLENIQLPFLLSAILLAVYTKDVKIENRKNILLILTSGICLGIAVFTKIPVFIMIPSIGYLIYINNSRNFKLLGLWLVPIILLPSVWPINATLLDELDDWKKGIFWQTHRIPKLLGDSIMYFLKLDPLLLLFGTVGIIFAGIKKDYFILLVSIPFLLFLYLINYVSAWHFIPLLPIFCISMVSMILDITSNMISKFAFFKPPIKGLKQKIFNISSTERISNSITEKKEIMLRLLPFILIAMIGIIGLLNVVVPISSNIPGVQLKIISFVAKILVEDLPDHFNDNTTTIIGNSRYNWLFPYAFDMSNYNYVNQFHYKGLKDSFSNSEDFVLIIEKSFMGAMSRDKESDRLLKILFNNSKTIAKLDDAHRQWLWLNNNDIGSPAIAEIRVTDNLWKMHSFNKTEELNRIDASLPLSFKKVDLVGLAYFLIVLIGVIGGVTLAYFRRRHKRIF